MREANVFHRTLDDVQQRCGTTRVLDKDVRFFFVVHALFQTLVVLLDNVVKNATRVLCAASERGV